MLRILTCIVAMFALHQAVSAQSENTSTRVIKILGEASATFFPDQADVSIGVETSGKNVADIKRDNDQRVKAVVASLSALGIPQKDIQTQDVSVSPVYDWSDSRRKFLRYEMRNSVRIRITDLSKLQSVIDNGLQEGSNILNSVAFSISRRDQIKDSLQVVAARNAKIQAAAVASAVNAQVGKVISIDLILPRGGRLDDQDYDAAQRMTMARANNTESTSTPVFPEEVKLSSVVLVTFELE
jgi:uncharacterized protein YggE